MQAFTEDSRHEIGSALIMNHLVCDELSFEREGFEQRTQETKFSISYKVEKDDDGQYRACLLVSAKRIQEYTATVKITGYFSISEDNPLKDTLLWKNALAIIFPFARSQMTLLTTQPETSPVIIPVVNINKIAEQGRTQSEEL